jgi:hypothetical protein
MRRDEGGSSTSRTENSIQAVERMVRENRRNTVNDIAEASVCLAQGRKLLRGRIFSSDKEVIGTVQNWLKTQPKNFFLTIKKLVKRWNRCVEVEGDYVEK